MLKKFALLSFAVLAWAALWSVQARAAGEWEWTQGQGWVMGAGASRPTPNEQLAYAYELEQRGEFMDAARQYFLLIRNFSSSQEAGIGLQRLARCLFEMENYYTSYKAVEQVIQTYPNAGRMSDLLAIELSIAKKMMVSQTPDLLSSGNADPRPANIRRALEIIDAVIDHDPFGPVAAEAYLVRGEGNLFLGEVNAARTAFDVVLNDFSRADPVVVARAKLGTLRCDSLVGEARPAELQEQIEVVREAERQRARASGGGRVDEFDDVNESIRQVSEVEAAKMMAQAAQYRRMGMRTSVRAAEFLYKEVVRRYPDTPQAGEARALMGDISIPPEEGRLARSWRQLKLNPFSWNRDPEPAWIVPQLNPEDMVMVDSGLGPIAGVPESGLPPRTQASAAVRPLAFQDGGETGYSPAAAPSAPDAGSNRPAPTFFDATAGAGARGGYGAPAGGGGEPYSPRLPAANPLPTVSEGDLIAVGSDDPAPYAGRHERAAEPALAPAPIPDLPPSYQAPVSQAPRQPVLDSLDYNTPMSDLIGPVRRSAGTPPAPLPEYVSGGYVQDAPPAGGYTYAPAYPNSYQPAPAYPAPAPDSSYYYPPPAYDITAGAPVAAPYYQPPDTRSSWSLGDDFR